MTAPVPQLQRKIGLLQASAINMIDMVGIGPFLTMPFVMHLMGENFLLPWIFGAVVALVDSCIWAELGAAFPLAGGSYQFLKITYKEYKWPGKLLPFLLVWQTLFFSALVVASAAIGFSNYLGEFAGLDYWSKKAVAGGVVLIAVLLLYRNIGDVGKISVGFGLVVLGTMLWIIITGLTHKTNTIHIYSAVDGGGFFSQALWAAIGMASVKTIYSYLGYYNVCHLGAEIKNPQRNIPRSIFLSVICIAVLYLLMNYSVAGVIPVNAVGEDDKLIARFFNTIYNSRVAGVATVLILLIALASLFAVMLGYSRVIYAASAAGDFFKPFARLHPSRNFPYISLLFIGALAFVFSFMLRMKEVITGIIAMRILVQFISQTVGLALLRRKYGGGQLPFRMWLYPLPVVLAIAVWLFVFFSTGWKFIGIAGMMIAAGVAVFIVVRRIRKRV